jgi:phosphoheptose isomerase
LQHGGKLMFFGNGESAAEAQQNHSLQDRPRMDRSRVLGDRHVDNDSARSITGPTGTFA